jgi:hypothetical protein
MAAVPNVGKEIRHEGRRHKAGEGKWRCKTFERERSRKHIQASDLLSANPPENS